MTPREKYAFIQTQVGAYPVAKMCRWLAVSTSGYYEWRTRPDSASQLRRRRLAVHVRAVFDDSDGTYGYRRVHAELARRRVACCPQLVRELMAELGLVACQPRPFRITTVSDGEGAAVPDLLGRDFTAARPGSKLVGDISYLHLAGLAVFGHRHRLCDENGGGLVDGRSHAHPLDQLRPRHGPWPDPDRAGVYIPFRSRHPIPVG